MWRSSWMTVVWGRVHDVCMLYMRSDETDMRNMAQVKQRYTGGNTSPLRGVSKKGERRALN